METRTEERPDTGEQRKTSGLLAKLSYFLGKAAMPLGLGLLACGVCESYTYCNWDPGLGPAVAFLGAALLGLTLPGVIKDIIHKP